MGRRIEILPPIDVIFTILPLLCFLIIGITCFITITAPKKFVSNCALISSIEVSSRAPPNAYPALLTTTSILFLSSNIVSMAFEIDLSSLTSSSMSCNGRLSFLAISVIVLQSSF